MYSIDHDEYMVIAPYTIVKRSVWREALERAGINPDKALVMEPASPFSISERIEKKSPMCSAKDADKIRK